MKLRIVKAPGYVPAYGFEVGQVLTGSKAHWNKGGGYMVDAPGNGVRVHLSESEAVPVEEGREP